ncbi:MAG: serine hydrolase [Verrucomicrobia bacterium]|nr:serine hydrolase [Verrucomicrobiota bacterium]
MRNVFIGLGLFLTFTYTSVAQTNANFRKYTLGYNTPPNAGLQAKVEAIDTDLRDKHGISASQTAVGLLDLKTLRLAMINPDRPEYAASIPKIGILLAYFHLHPEAVTNLNPTTRRELGLMAKASSNAMAAKFSGEMGLKEIQQVITSYKLYDEQHGGGLWIGKHYGKGDERYGDPIDNHSHAATVRQLLRYYLWLEQGKLISPEASKVMREIFESPDIPHDNIKFVKALEGKDVQIIRKWGSWQNWLHDSAVITGTDRHYILVALTTHSKGNDYLVNLATAVDDLLTTKASRE